jgi:membrane protein YqaA with SNARE-associated domain
MDSSLFLLFLSAFLAATILPATSEIALATIVAKGVGAVWLPIAVATAGNTIGAVVNWLLGRFFAGYLDRKWFPLTPKQHERASRWFQRYGVWTLLFAWLPVVGDPLTLVAGLLRVSIWKFLVLVAIGKGARYVLLAEAVLVAEGLG